MTRNALRIAAAAALAFLSSACSRDPAYNVVLLSIDSLRADRIERMPNVKRLASEGVAFRDFSANASSTAQAQMSLFTGLYPSYHGLDNWGYAARAEFQSPVTLDPRIRTLPELLCEGPRRCARFAYSRDYFMDPALGFGRGFDENHPFGLDTARGAEQIVSWIREQRDRPFFAFVNSKRAHAPFTVGTKEQEILEGQLATMRLIYSRWVPGVTPDDGVFLKRLRLSENPRAEAIRAYDAGIAETDRYIGKVLDALRDADLLERTLVILTAPYGEALMEHEGLSHLTLHEEVARVPLIVRLPKALRKEPAGTNATPAETVDILPTVAELLGIPIPPGLNGRSLAPQLKDPAAMGPAKPRFAENTFVNMPRSSSVRDGKWKLIRAEDRRPALYDLSSDPGEERDLSASHPEAVKAMLTRLRELQLGSYDFEPGAGASRNLGAQSLSTAGLVIPAGFRPAGERMESFGRHQVTEYEYRSGPRVLRVIRLGPYVPPAVQRYFEDHLSGIRALYEPKLTDGFPSVALKPCKEHERPARLLNKDGPNYVEGLLLYADRDGTPGACGKDQATRRLAVILTYCRSIRSIFHLQYLAPASSFTESELEPLLKIRCESP